MIDGPKTQAAMESDGSRSNPLSGMMKQPRADAGTSTATVGATVTIRGDILGKGDVIVSGTVEGTVDQAYNLVSVEETGRVQGSIVAKRVRIKGEVVGDVEALEKITISATGRVQGTIIAKRVEVEDGARFMGRIDMDFDDARAGAASVSLLKD